MSAGNGRVRHEDEADDGTGAEVRKPTPTRRRGRPARLSRERVVDAALAILEQEPDEVPTIARIAREVEAVPAALYRHFDSLDDIFDDVLARVLEASAPALEEGASWPAQLATWMHDLRSHLLRYPAVMAMIGRSGRTSPAWLEASSSLVEILQRAGLSGHNQATTYLWILETTVGLVMQEAALPLPDQIANARTSGPELSSAARARFAPLEPAFTSIDEESFFAFVVEQAVAVVTLRLEAERKR